MEITPWPGPEPATEDTVKQAVRHSGLAAMRWEGEPDKPYLPHYHPYTKTLWCAAGNITFHIGSEDILMQPGDKMVLPAKTVHSAEAGPEGVVCYESPPVHENATIREEQV